MELECRVYLDKGNEGGKRDKQGLSLKGTGYYQPYAESTHFDRYPSSRTKGCLDANYLVDNLPQTRFTEAG